MNIGEPIAIIVENKEDIPNFANVTKETLEGGSEPAEPAEPVKAAEPAEPAEVVVHTVPGRCCRQRQPHLRGTPSRR